MDRIHINIDELARQQHPLPAAAWTAADIVIAAFREAGIDPRKAAANAMAVSLAQSWTRGELTREQFMHACRNLLILNPKLRLERT